MEWGYLFVPIQAGWLNQEMVEGLLLLQLAMKPISFALLLQFGIELLVSRARPGAASARPLRAVPAVAVGLWALFTLAISRAIEPGFQPDPGSWLPSAQIGPALNAVGAPLAVGDVVARVLLAFPASVLVALGLRRTARALGPMAGPRVGLALAVGRRRVRGVRGPRRARVAAGAVSPGLDPQRPRRRRGARRADRGLPLHRRVRRRPRRDRQPRAVRAGDRSRPGRGSPPRAAPARARADRPRPPRRHHPVDLRRGPASRAGSARGGRPAATPRASESTPSWAS